MGTKFMQYIELLKDIKAVNIEPVVEKLTEEQQRTLREEQDLANGAVRIGITRDSEHAITGPAPRNGDLVVFHFTVRENGLAKVLASTESQHGGDGCPHAAVVFKGNRIPRGWELGMADMREGQRAMIITSAAYGFDHADCLMARPTGVSPRKDLHTEVHLLKVIPADRVSVNATDSTILKAVQQRGPSWESPRRPYEVSIKVAVTDVSSLDTSPPLQPVTAVLGANGLPPGVETAVSSMNVSERSVFVVPSSQLEGGSDTAIRPLQRAQLQAVHVELVSFVEVRDMTGDGQLFKKKMKQGRGSFPVDAPMNDATVTVHYSVHLKNANGTFGPAVLDTRQSEPLQFSTGEGCMPEGLEMALRLMLPGECSEVTCGPKYGYSSCSAAPPAGVDADSIIKIVVDMLGFEKEGHPQAMDAEQIIAWATRQKDAANRLYKTKKTDFAVKKYDKTLRTLSAFRECVTDEHFDAVNQLKLTLLFNLAAAYIEQQEYAEAIRKCDALLELDEGNMRAMLRKARALSLNGDHQECRSVCSQIIVGDQVSRMDVDDLQAVNDRREKDAAKKQKDEFKKFFSR